MGIAAVTIGLVSRPMHGRAAAPARPAIHLDYEAPSDCPPAEALTAQISQRLVGVRLDETPPPVLSIEITDGLDGGKRGRLRRWENGVATAPREVRAASCEDVVRALALTAALSLGGRIGGDEPPPAPPRGRTIWRAGVDVTASRLLPPQPMTAGGVFLARDDDGWPRGPALHRPELRLAVVHARNDVVRTIDDARFTLTLATLAACPFGWGPLRACALGEVGALDGRGVDVAVPVTHRSLWLAAGGELRLRATFGSRLSIEAHAGLRAPLRRESFVFVSPHVLLATVPAVVPDAGLTFGLTFP